jgi:hypothetical protein
VADAKAALLEAVAAVIEFLTRESREVTSV